MGFVSGNHIIFFLIFLVIVLVIFGPGKLPDVGSGMGKAIREFRKASSEVKESVASSTSPDPKPETPATSPAPGASTTVEAPGATVEPPQPVAGAAAKRSGG